MRGRGRAEIAKRTQEALELVGLHGFADRYATQLSGGQQQRVSLARALAYNPHVVLFDEPLSNLDAKLREHMRYELTWLQQRLGITAVYVTHDQSEVLVMNHGRMLQQGAPEAIYAEPTSRFVADFIGVANLLPVRVVQPTVATGVAVVETAWGAPCPIRCVERMPLVAGSDAVVTVRPEDLTLWTDMPMTTDNVLSGRVRDIIYLGNFLDCRIDIDGYELRVQLNHDEALPRGDRVYLTFAIDACHGLPNEP